MKENEQDKKYIDKTLEEINLIIEYTNSKTIDELSKDKVLLDAIVFRMIQMSEHLDKISDEFKASYPNIKWMNIKGFRNRLVHDYGGVNLQFVYNAITVDIIELKEELLRMCYL